MNDDTFELDKRLANDTALVGDLPLCRVLLMNDSHYPWLILVPRLAGVTELFQLSEAQQLQAQQESSMVAEKMARHFAADKMNVAALGNIVKQLHIHHVARFESDIAWPAPVWGAFPAKPYQEAAKTQLLESLRELLAIAEK